MNIRPNLAYGHMGYPIGTYLETHKVYKAVRATNQPDWKKQGLVFVDCPNGAPELLLRKGEYTIVR